MFSIHHLKYWVLNFDLCPFFLGRRGHTVRVVFFFFNASVMGKFALYNLTLQFPFFFLPHTKPKINKNQETKKTITNNI